MDGLMPGWCDEGVQLHASQRIHDGLSQAIESASGSDCPPRLSAALRHAVFSGGARMRPRLCIAVAVANGDPQPEITNAGAVALELLHCASLVHDDLPAFDDAPLRRGRPAVHAVFGDAIAILAGDALIVEAFATIARAASHAPQMCVTMTSALARATGSSRGLVAGQGWESEASVDLDRYHRTKTAALFEAAAVLGATSAGVEASPWRPVGVALGAAYQLADDLADVLGDATKLGKPSGQDARRLRPNAVNRIGVASTKHVLTDRIQEMITAVPPCPGRDQLAKWLEGFATRIVRQSTAGATKQERAAAPRGCRGAIANTFG